MNLYDIQEVSISELIGMLPSDTNFEDPQDSGFLDLMPDPDKSLGADLIDRIADNNF